MQPVLPLIRTVNSCVHIAITTDCSARHSMGVKHTEIWGVGVWGYDTAIKHLFSRLAKE